MTPKIVCKFGGGATTTAIVHFSFFQSFWYFLLCATLGEGALSWLSVGYGVASRNHYFFHKVKVLRGGFTPMDG